MSLIDTYYHFGEGYEPYLITENWQVAQLNYSEELSLAKLDKIEVHKNTDEVFILVKGRAILVAAKNVPDAIWFETIDMMAGKSYNVPKGRWHAVVMKPDSEIIIVEDANTHHYDVEYHILEQEVLDNLKSKLNKIL